MNIKQISTEQDYREALKRLEVIFDADLNTPAGDELYRLGKLIDDYENHHFPIELPNPIEAIKFRNEQMNAC